VPSRLIGECVKVRVFEDHIVVRYNDKDQLACERIRGHEYLRILHLAASTLEADVEAALDLLLAENQAITSSVVKTIVTSKPPIAVPDLQRHPIELASYNSLLEVGT
jgi:hypothetical protein